MNSPSIVTVVPFFSTSAADFSVVSLRNIELFKGARPSKIFPAISSGVPVLYCGDGESAAILEEYNCGKIAPPENPEGIAHAISELMTISSDEYQAMSEYGRKLARRNGLKRLVERQIS